MLTREDCESLDAQDRLAGMRRLFTLPDGVIYLDGNSLGALPAGTPEVLARTVRQEWGQGLIRSWPEGWYSMPEQLGDRIGRLIGAAPGQTVVCDGTSVNIYKALRAAMAMRSGRNVIVSDASSFPTDLYIVEGAINSAAGYEARLLGRDSDDIADLLDDRAAAVLLSNVDYRTGRLLDMEGITGAAHKSGALVIWDLCHSAGVVPLRLDAVNADFAVGCTYKYLNGGPGSPAFIYVARRHHNSAVQPLSGWWGHASPFAFEQSYRPVEGIRRFLVGTQSVLGLKGVEAALEVFENVSIDDVRKKSQLLGDTFIQLIDQRPECAELTLASPRSADVRGSQVSYRFAKGYPVIRAMIEQGVIGDFREPGIMRFGLAPYYLRFADLFDAVALLADCMRRKVWTIDRFNQVGTVT